MTRFLIAAVALLIACLGAVAAQAQKAASLAPAAGPQCIVDVDVNDEVWLRRSPNDRGRRQ